jgi:FMN phosphatase YigB (HAD superfamily)
VTPFLIFDAYGTLVELDDFYGRLQHGFARHDVVLPLDVVKKAAHREMKHYMANSLRAHQENEWHELSCECAQILADAVRAQDYPLSLSTDQVLPILADAIVFHAFPETREVLQELQRREVPMGVMSNWDYQLPLVLRSLGLDTFFQFIVPSTEAGAEKPSPAFFSYGLKRVQETHPHLEPRHCFYIGDHYEKDVLPARAAGMMPLWLVRDQRDVASGEVHEAHDDVVRLWTLKDLLQVIMRV